MAEPTGQFLDDAQSLRALVEQMNPADLGEYQSYGALGLESAFPNRRMVVYTLRAGRPDNVEVLDFGDIWVTRADGPKIWISEVPFTCVPERWRGRDLFLHVPQNFVLKWKGKQTSRGRVEFVPHYAVLIKTRSKEIHQVEGHTYCVTLNKFRERFPQFTDKVRY